MQGLREAALVKLVSTHSHLSFHVHLDIFIDVCFSVGPCLPCLVSCPLPTSYPRQSIQLQQEPFETEINEEVENENQRLEAERLGKDQGAEKEVASPKLTLQVRGRAAEPVADKGCVEEGVQVEETLPWLDLDTGTTGAGPRTSMGFALLEQVS